MLTSDGSSEVVLIDCAKYELNQKQELKEARKLKHHEGIKLFKTRPHGSSFNYPGRVVQSHPMPPPPHNTYVPAAPATPTADHRLPSPHYSVPSATPPLSPFARRHSQPHHPLTPVSQHKKINIPLPQKSPKTPGSSRKNANNSSAHTDSVQSNPFAHPHNTHSHIHNVKHNQQIFNNMHDKFNTYIHFNADGTPDTTNPGPFQPPQQHHQPSYTLSNSRYPAHNPYLYQHQSQERQEPRYIDVTARYNPPPSQKSPSRSRTRRKANNIVDVDISAADVYDCPTHTPLRANRRQNLSRCEEVSRMTKTCDLGRAMSSFKKIISGGRKPNGRYSRPPGLGYSGSSSVLGGLDNTRKKKKKESRDIVPQVVID